MDDRIDVVIPCRNGAMTAPATVKALANHPAIGNVIVVVNPPDGDTEKALRGEYGVVTLHANSEGKGQAVMLGLALVETEHVVFCDADMTGLTLDHVSQLVAHAVMGEDSMTIGIPEIPSNYPHKRLWAWPWVSGQRCIPTRLVKPLLLHGYLMETQINAAAKHAKYPVHFEWLDGLHSPFIMSEKRLADMERDAKWGKEHGIL